MYAAVNIHCHCGGYHTENSGSGDSGWWDCKCGCSYAYRNVDGQAEVKKVGKCEGKKSKHNKDVDFDEEDEVDDNQEDW